MEAARVPQPLRPQAHPPALDPDPFENAAHRGALRNVLPAGPGVCAWCHRPIAEDREVCLRCAALPSHLDLVVPITYAIRGAPIHLALRAYKQPGAPALRAASALLVARVLHRFLASHQDCVARATGVERFDLVTTIPSSDELRDRRDPCLRRIVEIALPPGGQHQRLLAPTGRARDRSFNRARYCATRPLDDQSILLLDDTWVTGAHAQSAAAALRDAGASKIALLVIGRYLRPDWPAGAAGICAARLDEVVTTPFDWSTCAVHIGTGPRPVPPEKRGPRRSS